MMMERPHDDDEAADGRLIGLERKVPKGDHRYCPLNRLLLINGQMNQ